MKFGARIKIHHLPYAERMRYMLWQRYGFKKIIHKEAILYYFQHSWYIYEVLLKKIYISLDIVKLLFADNYCNLI